ncbi:MAG: ShlB/FhaC/HecB family hemolysin secretion/activation protein [Oxalobacter sp.]|nr:MAG: ShlB/FhaC/HecB family hemolysin secretion/activation protein [Oxalobacter sp.]
MLKRILCQFRCAAKRRTSKNGLIWYFVGVSFGVALFTNALAQSSATIAAQELQRQQERERILRQQQEKTPDVRLERPQTKGDTDRLPIDESPCFRIERIALTGDAVEKFQWALEYANLTDDQQSDPVLKRCLGMRGINQVMRRMQNAIIQRGYVTTRVLAAPQDLKTGTLTLTLIPGRIRHIRFEKGTDIRATQINAMPAQPGDLLNLRDIEQALENFKRVPTADADIQIIPAEGKNAKPGESDVVIKWKQGFPFRISLSADDSGTKATGKYQGGVTVSYDHWWILNDLFYVSYNHDLGGGDPGKRGTRSHTVHYSVPYGYWLLGLTTSENNYHQQVAGASQNYIYSGKSQNSDIKLSRLIYRDAVRKDILSIRGWYRESQNYIDDTEVEVQRRRMAGWEFGASHKEFIGASTLDANLNYKRGTGVMGSRRAPEEDFGEGTSRPTIITADAQLNVPFAIGKERFRYNASWRQQWNRTPLVPQDRFSIGGRYTVRGFDGESVLMGDRGWLIRNDLGWTVDPSGHELYLGVDHGKVSGLSAHDLAGTSLTGAVIGLRGNIKGVNYDAFVGHPIHRPSGFQTDCGVVGFNVIWSY